MAAQRHTIGRYAKAGLLAVALVVLAGEGYLLYQWYDRSQSFDAAAPDSGSAVDPQAAGIENADPDAEASFVHRATDGNSFHNYTYVSYPSIDGDAYAVVLVAPNPDGEDAEGDAYGHNVGVWYEPRARRWAIFNQDLARMRAGTDFRVVVPWRSESFIHNSTPENTSGDGTLLRHPSINAEPGASLSVTLNWNPGGGRGVYNDHPVAVRYDEDEKKWAVFNRDGAPMPEGASFNVAVWEGAIPAG